MLSHNLPLMLHSITAVHLRDDIFNLMGVGENTAWFGYGGILTPLYKILSARHIIKNFC